MMASTVSIYDQRSSFFKILIFDSNNAILDRFISIYG